MKNIPNLLTKSRLAAIPMLILFFYINTPFGDIGVLLLFVMASITDFFDGYLARTLSAQSRFGQVFDPIADKLIVSVAIMMLIYRDCLTGIHLIPAILMVSREIFISGIREFTSSNNLTIPVSNFGKIKTTLQIISISVLIASIYNTPYFLQIGYFLFWIAAAFSAISAKMYLDDYIKLYDST